MERRNPPRDEDWAWGYLTRLLSYRPRTEAELRRRLAAKGCPPEVVERVIGKAKEAGLVDDELFARLYAEDRLLSRPRSRRLLARELSAKGLPRGLADRAAAQALPELPERALARKALESRLHLWQGLPDEKRKRRAYAFLLRRGFPPELAREVVSELLVGDG
ncbi:RecX family transcriptional regulator [Candidatus Acetothermia bacterium]|nr:MAG: RecX family transcriptional regulator [Candidatus Acetothermia bacterium]